MDRDKGRVYLELPEFSGGNVPVMVAAKVMRKDPQYIRQGILQGILDIGYALKKEGSSQYDYYISPLKLYLATGYIYKGE